MPVRLSLLSEVVCVPTPGEEKLSHLWLCSWSKDLRMLGKLGLSRKTGLRVEPRLGRTEQAAGGQPCLGLCLRLISLLTCFLVVHLILPTVGDPVGMASRLLSAGLGFTRAKDVKPRKVFFGV